jgi:nitroreductase
MELNQVIANRFSVRSYTGENVDRKITLEILDAARIAPSAVNFQPWHFIVVDEEIDLAELRQVYQRNWFTEAPACIVVCSDHTQSWKRISDGKDFADVDAAIAIDHLILKATDMGLGTCWVCNFDVNMACEKLHLPAHIEPVAIIPVGYSNAVQPLKTRKPLEELVHWGRFTNL